MSDSNLSVRITADVQDLQVKFAVAKAEVNGLTSEMNKLAKASSAGIIDSAGASRLQQVAGDLLAARQQAAGYAGELEKAGFAQNTFGRAMEGGHGSISTATREFRALFDELSSGRTRMTPGTLAIIAQKVIGLGPAALGAVAGVGVLVGGLIYLTAKAIQASKALDSAFLGAQFAGNLEISREAIKQFADEMSKARNISGSEAREIATSLASIPGITTPIFHALTAEVSDFARLTGKEAPKAAEELAKAFNAKTSAAEFARSIGGVTQAQINMAEQADRSGDAIKAQETKFSLLMTTVGRSTTSIDQQNNKLTSSIGNFFAYAGALAAGNSAEEVQADILARSNVARQQQLEILKQTASQLSGNKQTPDQDVKAGVGVAEKENPIAKQIVDTTAKIQVMESALQHATDPGNVALLNSALTKTREELSNLQFGPVLERMREQIAQVAVTWDGTQSGMLAKQIQIGQATLADVSKNAKERLAVETEVAHLEIEQRKAVGSEIVAQAHAQAAAASGDTSTGPIQRLQAERQVWAEVLAGDRITATQREEVARTLATTIASINKETASQNQAIARSDADTDIAIAKINIEAKRSALEQEVQANQVTAARKLQILRDLSSQTLSLDLQSRQAELATLNQGTAEYERVLNQEKELKAKQVLELQAYDKQYASETAKLKREEITTWRSAVGEIENAEGTLVTDLIGKRKTLSQSILQIGSQMVTKEIENDIKAYTTKLLLNNSEKALAQGGFLYHLLNSNKEVATTTAAETAKTSATTAGATARLAAAATASTTEQALQAATGPAQVMAYAAEAAAGAFAATAMIPYIGPELAPGAAAASYAAVATFAPMAALATGTNFVPRDMPAFLHKGEAVVPRQYNPSANGSGKGSQQSGGSGINLHVAAMDSRSVERSLKRDGSLTKALRDAHRRGAR